MEYNLQYTILFQCNKKNLERIVDVRALGSSITSMEMCMIIEDVLISLKLSDKRLKKISYNFNRDDKIMLNINLLSNEKLTKKSLDEIRDNFLSIMKEHFSNNRIHTFRPKDGKSKDVFVKII